MNIVLIGYRGTGKSTVARLLASQLGRPVVSLDEEVVKKAGMRIPEIIAQYGWDHFRTLESQVVEEVSEQDGLVIDAGGGVILRERNVSLLRKHGFLVWLTAPIEVIVERISTGTERPPLKQDTTFLEEIEEVLNERIPLYQAAAHTVLETAGMPPQKVVEDLLDHLQKEGHVVRK